MKPAPFRYLAATSTGEALAHLAEHGWDAKVLAGGQSLIPAMNFRLAQPAVLIDLNPVAELDYVRSADGVVRIGAMTRQATLERNAIIRDRVPLLAEALPHIAHPQIRARGTLGGSLAHADPAAEIPAVMVALDARFVIRGSDGERSVAAADFFLGLFMTQLQPSELLVEIEIPDAQPAGGHAFYEVARRHGDYALAGAAVRLEVDAQGSCTFARLALLSVGDGPMVPDAITGLVGTTLDAATIAATVDAASAALDPSSDIHASSEYRRHLAAVVMRRSLHTAAARAHEHVASGGRS